MKTIRGINLKDFSEITKIKNQLLCKILIDQMVEEGLLLIDESDLDLEYYLNIFLRA